MSVLVGNALSILKGNLRVVHGDEKVAELSTQALVNEVVEVYPGMMIAVPPPGWMVLNDCSADELAHLRSDLAERISTDRMLRSRRVPKKPRRNLASPGSKIHHVATKKLPDASKREPPAGLAKPNRNKINS